jgi:hypothetical protein
MLFFLSTRRPAPGTKCILEPPSGRGGSLRAKSQGGTEAYRTSQRPQPQVVAAADSVGRSVGRIRRVSGTNNSVRYDSAATTRVEPAFDLEKRQKEVHEGDQEKPRSVGYQ